MDRKITRTVTINVNVKDAATQTEPTATPTTAHDINPKENRKKSSILKQLRQQKQAKQEQEKKIEYEREIRRNWIEWCKEEIKEQYDEQIEETKPRRLKRGQLNKARELLQRKEREDEEDEEEIERQVREFETKLKEKLEEQEEKRRLLEREKYIKQEVEKRKEEARQKIITEHEKKIAQEDWLMKNIERLEREDRAYTEAEERHSEREKAKRQSHKRHTPSNTSSKGQLSPATSATPNIIRSEYRGEYEITYIEESETEKQEGAGKLSAERTREIAEEIRKSYETRVAEEKRQEDEREAARKLQKKQEQMKVTAKMMAAPNEAFGFSAGPSATTQQSLSPATETAAEAYRKYKEVEDVRFKDFRRPFLELKEQKEERIKQAKQQREDEALLAGRWEPRSAIQRRRLAQLLQRKAQEESEKLKREEDG